MRGVYAAMAAAFLSAVGVALAGGAPDPAAAPVASCHGKAAAAPAVYAGGGCHGGQAVTTASSCHGKATRRTFAQRRADRQADRQADRAERRASAGGCHGGTVQAAPACSCGDCEACR
jgi:hypothetical protein